MMGCGVQAGREERGCARLRYVDAVVVCVCVFRQLVIQ